MPKVLDVVVNKFSTDMPTHMLAIYSREDLAGKKRQVTLFPTHHLVLAAHCANLPTFPASRPIAPTTIGAPITLPVVPLCLSSPETFPWLLIYLYSKRADQLLASILPFPPGLGDVSIKASLQLAQRFAASYTAQALFQLAGGISGFWRNVCALGVYDDKLWGVMTVAWEVVLKALEISKGMA